MDRAKPKRSDRRLPAVPVGGPPPPTLLDYQIRAQGGTTTAFDTIPEVMDEKKAAISNEERIVELTLENGRLRLEIDYYKTLVTGVLYPIMTLVPFHVNGLHSAFQKFNSKIERVNQDLQSINSINGRPH
ncbi:hypothetical protein BJ170DRAFT_174863 [Xylariales sp. AK1849]|nr:hypothetical protein BJ170DRAFT_174863 [Xylariales sp. AK1849]